MFSRALRRVQAMTERDKLGLALLVLLWLVAGWWFFFHVPMRAAVEVMQEESAEAHAQLVDVENYRQQGQSIAAAEKAQKERHGRRYYVGVHDDLAFGVSRRLSLSSRLAIFISLRLSYFFFLSSAFAFLA